MTQPLPMMGGLLPSPGSVPRAPSRWLYPIFAAAGLLALIAVALWVGTEIHDNAVRRMLIRGAYQRQLGTAELVASLTQAESAERGYVITGNPGFLAAYGTARTSVEQQLSRSSAYAASGDSGDARLRTLIDARLSEMALVIGLRQRSGLSAAADHIALGRGVSTMAAARLVASDLAEAERQTMRFRGTELRRSYTRFLWILWGVTLLIGVLMLAGVYALWRVHADRYVLERNAHDMSTRLFGMFAGNAEAMLVLDDRGRIEAANAAAKRLLGYGTSDLVGRDIMSLFDLADERDFPTRIGLADGRVAHPYWPDRIVRHSDGSGIPVDIALGAMNLPDGSHVLMAMRDIAERKSVERLKDEFLATISHELRTPLTSVVGALGLLRKGSVGNLPEAADRLVEIAENNSRRLIRLVNDLLDIEKIGTGQMRFERVPIDLVHVAEAAVDGALGIGKEKDLRITVVAPERPLIVRGDRERLLQVLANLLSNAVRVSPAGGTVLVTVERNDGTATVTVDDEGPGIPAEFRGRIFERFAQATNGADGGSGLGLAISREIVVAHDGRIWFGRSPAGGARFAFALPMSRIEEPLRGSRPCILLAEADPVEARRLQDMLEAEECAVDLVTSDRATLEAAVSGRYDALVIDVELPAMGGLETVRALRRRAETLALPVVLVSDHAIAGENDRGLALGAVDWIDKPVEQGRLAVAVRRAVIDSARVRPTLLHIDDDVDMLEIAAAVLAEQARVVHATSLASARALISMQMPDVVILDLLLPDGSGIELLPELLRADGAPIPTIIYSAADVPPEYEQQVDAVLVKSRRSLDSLARVVRRILVTRPQDGSIPA